MKELKVILLFLFSIFAPIKAALITVFVLTLIDLVTGVLAAWKRGEKITSRNLRRSVVKLLVFEVAILLAFLTQTFLTGPQVPVTGWVTSIIGLTEFTSVLENLELILGANIFRAVIDRIHYPKEAKPKNSED